jgi:arginine utilization protein RocB
MKARAAAIAGGQSPGDAWQAIPVLTYATLVERAQSAAESFAAELAAEARKLAGRSGLDLPSRSREIMEFVWKRSGLEPPAIVLCIGSMPYPAVKWPPGFDAVEAAIKQATAETSAAHDCGISIHPFFPAIADMSFIGPVDEDDLKVVAANTPLWGSSIVWPARGPVRTPLPVINVGPWGRDYHHWLERTHDGYSFRVLPDLVAAIGGRVLAA